jgi:hypothetical protein
MSKVVTTTVLPDVAGGSVTLGGTGDSVVVTGNDIRTNAMQDAGGNALFTSNGSGVLSGMNSGLTSGALNLLSTQTASGASSVSFTTGIDSTYDVYIFKFIEMNLSVTLLEFGFQVNASGQTGFDEVITSTTFLAEHSEADGTGLEYRTSEDQAQGTAYQKFQLNTSNDSDSSISGEMYLFAPSGTTYVKHFYINTIAMGIYSGNPSACNYFVGGYINTTSAITEIDFKPPSGNFDGTIKMYGISKS